MGMSSFPRKKSSGHKPFYGSKKWWMRVLAIIIPVVNNRLGLNLSVEEMAAIVIPIVTYVVVEGWTDAANKGDDSNGNYQYK